MNVLHRILVRNAHPNDNLCSFIVLPNRITFNRFANSNTLIEKLTIEYRELIHCWAAPSEQRATRLLLWWKWWRDYNAVSCKHCSSLTYPYGSSLTSIQRSMFCAKAPKGNPLAGPVVTRGTEQTQTLQSFLFLTCKNVSAHVKEEKTPENNLAQLSSGLNLQQGTGEDTSSPVFTDLDSPYGRPRRTN